MPDKVTHYSHSEFAFDSTIAKLHGTYINDVEKNLPEDHRYVTCCLSGQHATKRVNGNVRDALEAAIKEVHRKAALKYAEQLRPKQSKPERQVRPTRGGKREEAGAFRQILADVDL